MATPSRSDTSPVADEPIRRVGFIGLGDMGGAMVERIVAARFPTVLWARRADALLPFEGPLVAAAASPAALAAEVDLVGICVWADDDVRTVMLDDDGVLAGCRPGTIVAIHSTVRPETCRSLAEAAEPHDVIVIDAAVSGGRDVALAGGLVAAVGGPGPIVDRCRPVFATFADPVVHVGPLGTGQLAKLINNSLLAANLAVADDALALGETLGIPSAELAQVLRMGSGRSVGLDVAITTRESAEKRQRALPPLEKDVRSLIAQITPGESPMPKLVEAALDALTRLAHPPPGQRDIAPGSDQTVDREMR